jgi:hypothetical protein
MVSVKSGSSHLDLLGSTRARAREQEAESLNEKCLMNETKKREKSRSESLILGFPSLGTELVCPCRNYCVKDFVYRRFEYLLGGNGRMKAISRNFALALGLWLTAFAGYSDAASPELLKGKQEAETKGYVFATSHDQIVATAKKEGRMRAVSFLSGKMLDAMVRAFRAKYPFLDVHVEEQGGSVEAAQRFLLEIKAGIVKTGMPIASGPSYTMSTCRTRRSSTFWAWPSTRC